MPNDEGVVGITSRTILYAINQPHSYLFLDGTYLKDVSVRENLFSIFCLVFIPEDGVVPTLSLSPSLLPILDYVEIPTLYNTDAELDIQQSLSGTVLVPHRKKKYANFDLRCHQIRTVICCDT